MRIVIDMQGAQTESRFRGIGRYTLSFARSIVKNRGKHEIILALSGLFPDTIEPIRAAFGSILPQENIHVWQAPGPVCAGQPGNSDRRANAELVREAFMASLRPDVIHISSLFEGYVDDAVTSIGVFDTATPVSVTLYDLIPLLNPDHYLKPNSAYEKFYLQKIEYLKRAGLYLAISEFSRQETVNALSIGDSLALNISTALDDNFKPVTLDAYSATNLRQKFSIKRAFILYTGGADERKNLPRLIEAFSALPGSLRDAHQLVFAGRMPEGDIARFEQQARSLGLAQDELLFTGYVSDDELILLYNLCALYVFPSWHEGFGLPALEAMACGAPVIGSNTSSLPEVIGLDAALFDPYDVAAITAKMALFLGNEALSNMLRQHGIQRAKLFSWDESAIRAITAWEALEKSHKQDTPIASPAERKLRLAYVSPLPPERTGIADYSAELLPFLATHYDIDVVVAQDMVDTPKDHRYKIRDISWFRANANEIDRVIYQIGNSPFHQHMLPLMLEIPGTVVLHDFYLSSLMSWMEMHAGSDHAWTEALYMSHGYAAVRDRYHNPEAAKRDYPNNFFVLQNAKGVITHSEYSRNLVWRWYGKHFVDSLEVIPLTRSPAVAQEKAIARKELGLAANDFIICSFGFLDSSKLNHRLINAWLCSNLSGDDQCRLIFVGENCGGEYGAHLEHIAHSSNYGDRIHITGFASPERFRQYLVAADLAVQLRSNSRGETSAAVLDCMNYGLPLIINANGSMAEIDPNAVWMLPDEFEDAQLIHALERLREDPQRRLELGEHGTKTISQRHAPEICALRYAEAIERFHNKAQVSTSHLLKAVATNNQLLPSNDELVHLSRLISQTLPLAQPSKRLFLDLSATCRVDIKTGIERVARALLLALLESPPAGYRIEPVYLSDTGGIWHHRYARSYTLRLLDLPSAALPDEPIDPTNGDIILSLDLSGDIFTHAAQSGLFRDYRNQGIMAYAIVFDLLPVHLPEVFPPGANPAHLRWLKAISDLDGAICISQTVADDLLTWQTNEGIRHEGRRPFSIDWIHLGADVTNTAPSMGLPGDAEWTLTQLRAHPSFLLVGTIEPRKGYLQAVEAFTQLWANGTNVNLVIVGAEGWKGLPDDMRRNIPETITRLNTHPELNKRLFWLNGISDEYLEKIYDSSTCLISASYGEGFGLPLIEAAQHGLPIIARDIPVYREVAGDHAFYFDGYSAYELSTAIIDWMSLYKESRHPISDTLPWLTWSASAQQLLGVLGLTASIALTNTLNRHTPI